MTLSFPKDDHMFELFSCTRSEELLPDSTKRMSGVLMEGSAIGILGNLLNFERNASQVRAVHFVPDRQYIMRTSKSRQFVYLIMISERQANERGNLDVRLEKKLSYVPDALRSRFFNSTDDDSSESRAISEYIAALFLLVPRSLESKLEGTDSGSEDEYGGVVDTRRKRLMGKMHQVLILVIWMSVELQQILNVVFVPYPYLEVLHVMRILNDMPHKLRMLLENFLFVHTARVSLINRFRTHLRRLVLNVIVS